MNIYVTPTDYFTTKFRKIFTKAMIKITTSQLHNFKIRKKVA